MLRAVAKKNLKRHTLRRGTIRHTTKVVSYHSRWDVKKLFSLFSLKLFRIMIQRHFFPASCFNFAASGFIFGFFSNSRSETHFSLITYQFPYCKYFTHKIKSSISFPNLTTRLRFSKRSYNCAQSRCMQSTSPSMPKHCWHDFTTSSYCFVASS